MHQALAGVLALGHTGRKKRLSRPVVSCVEYNLWNKNSQEIHFELNMWESGGPLVPKWTVPL